MSTIALGFPPQAGNGSDIPAELRIPPRPQGARQRPATRTPAWREAMRWALFGLTTSLAAGEVALALFGP